MTISYTPNLSVAIEATSHMTNKDIAAALGYTLQRVRCDYVVLNGSVLITNLRAKEVRGWLVRKYAVMEGL